MKQVPHYWRLSAFYFFYFSSLGVLIPYWGLYLHTIGFTTQEIGELIAIILATKIIAPIIWGWIADHTGQHLRIVRLNAFFGMFLFLGIFLGNSYIWLAIILGLFSFFWNAALPQFEAITFAHLAKQSHRYSHIRLWGSVGFVIAVLLFGWLFEHISVTLLPTLLMGLLASIWLSSFLVPPKKIEIHNTTTDNFYAIIKKPAVIAFFVTCFLMQASHGPYYTFYSIYLEQHGYNRSLIGQLWALGVISEVALFIVIHRILVHFSLKSLFIFSLGITGIRWLLISYYVDSLTILLVAQLLHAVSFGLFHSIAMQLIRSYFPDNHQGKAQALYGSLSFGAGGAIGSFTSGYFWNLGATVIYSVATIICVIAMWISWQWISE
ncbi:MAG: MFS transporter [Thiomargarita sp.]|nr:MFS transporter [Thiomargarita sp.]